MIISMPKILQQKLGEEGAEALVRVLNERDIAERNELVTKGDLKATAADLKADLAGTKAELLKWMFLFWIGQAATVIGIMMAFTRMRP